MSDERRLLVLVKISDALCVLLNDVEQHPDAAEAYDEIDAARRAVCRAVELLRGRRP